MNYETFQRHVKRNLGNRTDIDVLIGEWINSCYLDVITTGKLPEAGKFAPIPCPELDDTDTFYTSLNDDSFTLPTTALFIVSLRDLTNDNPIKQRDIRWYDRYRSTGTGPPERYAQFGREVYWDPAPDASYQIQRRVRKKVTVPTLTANSDVPIIGEEYHNAIEEAATYRGMRSLGYPEADKWLRDLKNSLAAHCEQYTEEEEDWDGGFSIKM